MPRALLALTPLFLAAAVVAYQQKANRTQRLHLERQLALAQSENARLHGLVVVQEKARTLERTRALREETEREVETIRGLKFKQLVEYAAVSRKEIKSVVAQALAEDNTDAEYENFGRAYARLGLLPAGLPLRQTLIDLLGEQIAAFYDYRRHKLYMFEDASLEQLQDRVVLAHELTHALQDQHFHLASLPIQIKTNDDRALAAMAVIEGDATQVMTVYMAERASLQALVQSAASVMTQQVEQLHKAPRYLRERLLFPYLRGKEFCEAVSVADGLGAIDRCYAKVPGSSSQIIHPGSYFSHPDPVTIEWSAPTLNGDPPAVDNVAGEFGIRVLLTEWADLETAEAVSPSWRGDRYLWFAKDDALVWKTVWATAADADRFAEAERKVLARRYKLSLPEVAAGRIHAEAARCVTIIRGTKSPSVLVLDASTPSVSKEMEKLWSSDL